MGRVVVDQSQVTAVIVTRGDVRVEDVLERLHAFGEVIVWDNSQRENRQCFGRFAGAMEAEFDHVYVQDDDLVINAGALLEYYDGDGIVANKPPDEEWRFLGGGAFFPKALLDTGWDTRFLGLYPDRKDFDRVADVVFAYSLPYRSIWVGYEQLLPWHDAPNRMFLQPDHYLVRERARERALALNSAV